MHLYEFDLILDTEPDDDTVDRLYGHFGADGDASADVRDFTITVSDGVPAVSCSVEAVSFDEALGMVLPALRAEHVRITRVEMDEEGLALLGQAA
jgi:hypothetical protein